jgi:hypothetical protein
VKLDRRHDRRALPLVELRKVFKAAAESTRVFRGLGGATAPNPWKTRV